MGIRILKISIAIVVYRPNLTVLNNLFTHLNKSDLINLKLVVYLIDNSNDPLWHEKLIKAVEEIQSISSFKIELIKSPGNIGYGRANNLIINKIDSDYHLVLNPDVFVFPDTLQLAALYMERNPQVGLLLPAIYSENNERQYLCKKNPTLFIMFLRGFAPKFLREKFHNVMDDYEMKNQDYDNVIEDVQNPSGCFMFFRTAIFKKIKGFDPRYFLYYEDSDIGREVLEISHSAYVPHVKITHLWARGTHNNWRLRWATIKSGFIYVCKWNKRNNSK